ncbi:MAG: hypothetical protein DYG89_41390 [Caldilinea sp. CFX5]|nr:hypothetical protein [Caldilinea sp. CFX5]
MNQDLLLTPAQTLHLRLTPSFEQLRIEFQERARQVAPALQTLNPTQLRGLVNALTGGRRTPREQRRALAEFLAWRALRAAKAEENRLAEQPVTNGWQRLVQQVIDEIESIEAACLVQWRSEIEQLHSEQEAYWAAQSNIVAAVQRELTMNVIAAYTHTLVRLAIIQQQMVQSGAIEGAGDAKPKHAAT